MDERDNAALWEENARHWVKLARAGYDRSRDLVNSPAFFAMLPEVRGLRGLDVGCGEGHNTRPAARRDGHDPPNFRIPRFTHTLSTWLNLLLDAGFTLERFCEPTADAATVAREPDLNDHRIIAYFLIIRARRW